MSIQRPIVIKKPSKKPIILLSALAAVIIIVTSLAFSGAIHLFGNERKHPLVTGSQDTKGEQTNSSTNQTQADPTPNPQSTTQPGDAKNATGGGSTAALQVPSGNFVSAHRVPPSATLASVCNTTAGASCRITFSKDGVVKSLPEQITDRGGSTYWNSWTPASIELTTGTWQIQAVASLNGKSLTATDALNLIVEP